MYQAIYSTPSISTNPVLTNNHPILVVPLTVPSISPTGLNRYTIRAESLKLQLPLKYNGSVEGNAYKEWFEEMRTYMFYYKKYSIFADEKKKINFAQRYFKDIIKRV